MNRNAKEKPSIYAEPEPELVLVETHSALERQIRTARRTVTATYRDAYGHIQGVVDRWIDVEHAVERRVKSIISPEEPLTPGVLYVGVATLTGSILGRNRSLLLRYTLPPAFLFLSMSHFFPRTSYNLSTYISSLERTHAPALADAHERVTQHTTYISSAIREAWQSSRDTARNGVERGVGVVQDRTGLKLREVFGWGQSRSETSKGEAVEKKVD